MASLSVRNFDDELEPMRPLLEPATKLAIALDHPAYDCAYLALAVGRECNFVTADESLGHKALPPGLPARIIVLTALGLS